MCACLFIMSNYEQPIYMFVLQCINSNKKRNVHAIITCGQWYKILYMLLYETLSVLYYDNNTGVVIAVK